MKLIYCVYDRVAGVYLPPFITSNEDVAIRMFNNAMEKNEFSKDLSLYRLGRFNDDTDGFISAVYPDFVCNAPVKVGE